MFALQHLLRHGEHAEEVIWMHDLDCWQNAWFNCPDMRDVGVCEYSQPKVNGGSVFWRHTAHDIVERVVDILQHEKACREEPTLNKVFKSLDFQGRVTILNPTFNVGCSDFKTRYERADQPIRICHLHPTNRIAWETHALDRIGCGYRSISLRLEALLRRYYTLATELSAEGRARQQGHRKNIHGILSVALPKPQRCYRVLRSFHLGDRWARVNYALRLLETGEKFSICVRDDLTKEILDLLDFGGLSPSFTTATPEDNSASALLIHKIDGGTRAYQCSYFPTKKKWHLVARVISYSFAANWMTSEKVPPYVDQIISDLRSYLPDYRFVEIGKPHQASLKAVVHVLARARLLLCIDNAMAHIARSVGVPLFLLEHSLPVNRGFPVEACRYTKVTQADAATVIWKYLAKQHVVVSAPGSDRAGPGDTRP
jgi:hypothetical protein